MIHRFAVRSPHRGLNKLFVKIQHTAIVTASSSGSTITLSRPGSFKAGWRLTENDISPCHHYGGACICRRCRPDYWHIPDGCIVCLFSSISPGRIGGFHTVQSKMSEVWVSSGVSNSTPGSRQLQEMLGLFEMRHPMRLTKRSSSFRPSVSTGGGYAVPLS